MLEKLNINIEFEKNIIYKFHKKIYLYCPFPVCVLIYDSKKYFTEMICVRISHIGSETKKIYDNNKKITKCFKL